MFRKPAIDFLDSATMTDPEAEIVSGRQRILRRNWRFSLLPAVILTLLLAVLGWEILRQNRRIDVWPWSISILGVGPAATLAGLFASLLFAREQFARSMRPNLLWSTQLRQSEVLGQPAWTIHLMNVGPALGHVDAIEYSIAVIGATGVVVRKAVSHNEVVTLLQQCGLQSGRDYHLELITPGAPLPVVRQRSEGIEFAAFTEAATTRLRRMNVSIVVIDTMGDRHLRSLPFLATLPDSALRRDRCTSQDTAEVEVAVAHPHPTTEQVMGTPPTQPSLPASAVEHERGQAEIVNPYVHELVTMRGNLEGDRTNDPFIAFTKS